MGGTSAPIRLIERRSRCDRGRRPKGTVVAAVAIWGLTVCPVLTPVASAEASFHLVQIEQVIGGVDGDTTAQAIQLRLRALGQDLFQFVRIRAWDAAGENPVTIIDFGEPAPNATFGARVLIASENFMAHLDTGLSADFTMTNLIPVEYLAAGRLTFERNLDEPNSEIYWSLSYGGLAYTGDTTGELFNDADGDFGPPFAFALPTGGTQALTFSGDALDLSTTNLDDYAFTSGQAVFTNSAGESATVGSCGFAIDAVLGTDLQDFALLQNCFDDISDTLAPCCESADLNQDVTIDLDDYGLLFNEFAGP